MKKLFLLVCMLSSITMVQAEEVIINGFITRNVQLKTFLHKSITRFVPRT